MIEGFSAPETLAKCNINSYRLDLLNFIMFIPLSKRDHKTFVFNLVSIFSFQMISYIKVRKL